MWYGGRQVDCFPRIRGNGAHHISYRHVIDWLLRKPGAFANYRYRDDLFPTTRFRMAYDYLAAKISSPARASKEYLQILNLAAKESESGVDDALRILFEKESEISSHSVLSHLGEPSVPSAKEVTVSEVDLENYDQLLSAHPTHLAHPAHITPWDEIVPLSEKVGAGAGAGGAL